MTGTRTAPAACGQQPGTADTPPQAALPLGAGMPRSTLLLSAFPVAGDEEVA